MKNVAVFKGLCALALSVTPGVKWPGTRVKYLTCGIASYQLFISN